MTMMQKAFLLFIILAAALVGTLFYYGHTPYVLTGILGFFVLLGLYDTFISKHNLLRNYPVAAYIRYGLEYIRPEIRQYFISSDTSERPFTREQRSIVYERAKKVEDTLPFGTEHDIREMNYLSARHSLAPKKMDPSAARTTIGGPECKQPYNASRINISAMSFGALSDKAIRALNRGAKLGNFAHNTGEGGLSDYHLMEGGDIIWQIGTGYFGCRTKDGKFDPELFQKNASKDVVKMIEIKLSQGAKPSHGGVLPGAKVTAEIARIRGVEEGVDCISPPAHSTFSTPVGLLEYVQQLRELSGGKPVGFKLCLGIIYEWMAICKAMVETKIYPDFITVDGAEGGTGAAPVEFTDRLGLACLEATNFVHNSLIGIGVRDKIKIIASGKTATGFDVVTKCAYGADTVNIARTMLFAVGCVQSRKCNTNLCPTGVATQNRIRSRAIDIDLKSQYVRNFHDATIQSAMNLLGAMGIGTPDDLTLHHICKQKSLELPAYGDELYPALKRGELLENRGPDEYLRHWHQAQAHTFDPVEKV